MAQAKAKEIKPAKSRFRPSPPVTSGVKAVPVKKSSVTLYATVRMVQKRIDEKKPINGKFDVKRFAADILQKRQDENLSFAALEETSTISRTAWHRAESGVLVTADSLIEICNWLGKPVQDYLTK
jgi:hypothetical protein